MVQPVKTRRSNRRRREKQVKCSHPGDLGFFDKGGEGFWGCPICKTERHDIVFGKA